MFIINTPVSSKAVSTLVLGSLFLLVGCGDKKEEPTEASKDATQVVAKVNGKEITIHQVNFGLQRVPNLTKETTKAASEQVLRSLVDMELVSQKAISEKMDRDTMVVQAMDAARRQVLAEFYMSRKVTNLAEPTDAEIVDYYKKNPEIFSERKIYQVQELAIQVQGDSQKTLVKEKLAVAKNLNDFVAWLKSENIPTKTSQAVKAAEQLPRAVLPQLAKMAAGQAMVINAPDGLVVLFVAGKQAQPISESQAKPVIQRLLVAQKRQQATKAELDAIKAEAKIEFVGEFAGLGNASAPAPKEETATDTTQPSPKEDDNSQAINKGLSGL